MSYNNEVKQSVLLRLSQGEKVKNISKETGISKATIYLWNRQNKDNKQVEEKDRKNSKGNNFKKEIKVSDEKLEKSSIKNNFMYVKRYLERKREDIYCNMQSTNLQKQKKAIIQWDKVEELLLKLNTNQCSKEYINDLYTKIQKLINLENKLRENEKNVKEIR